jgi:glutamyl/glutaminyl-tRNA synthetase
MRKAYVCHCRSNNIAACEQALKGMSPSYQYRRHCRQDKQFETIRAHNISLAPAFRPHELLVVALVPHRIGHRK